MSAVYLWRDVQGLVAFGHKSLADLQQIAALDAGGIAGDRAIGLCPLETDGWKEATIPDFPFTPGITLRLVSRHALEALGAERFESAGEFVSCRITRVSSDLRLFHVTRRGECLSTDAHFEALTSRFDFVPSEVPVGVPFYEENNGRRYLFVDDEFKKAVERHRLTGIRFEKVWSSEEGAFAYQTVDGKVNLAPVR